MKSFLSNDTTIHFETTGIAAGRQTLVFVNSLGTDFRIWRSIAELLSTDFNIVLYDKRGHGLSGLGNSPHRIETHSSDLAALLDNPGARSTVAVGLSVGGLIVQSLYHTRPDLVSKLVVSNSAVKIGTHDSWSERIATVQTAGIESFADSVMKKWFSPEFHRTQPQQLSLWRNMLARAYPAGYIACCEALRAANYTAVAKHISVPSLFIAGEVDGSTPVDLVQSSARLVPNSRFELIKGAAHIPCVEKPVEYATILRAFAA